MIRDYPTQWIGQRRPDRPVTARDLEFGRLLSDPVRIASAVTAYRHCLRDYLVDEEGLLRPRAAPAPQPAGT